MLPKPLGPRKEFKVMQELNGFTIKENALFFPSVINEYPDQILSIFSVKQFLEESTEVRCIVIAVGCAQALGMVGSGLTVFLFRDMGFPQAPFS